MADKMKKKLKLVKKVTKNKIKVLKNGGRAQMQDGKMNDQAQFNT